MPQTECQHLKTTVFLGVNLNDTPSLAGGINKTWRPLHAFRVCEDCGFINWELPEGHAHIEIIR